MPSKAWWMWKWKHQFARTDDQWLEWGLLLAALITTATIDSGNGVLWGKV